MIKLNFQFFFVVISFNVVICLDTTVVWTLSHSHTGKPIFSLQDLMINGFWFGMYVLLFSRQQNKLQSLTHFVSQSNTHSLISFIHSLVIHKVKSFLILILLEFLFQFFSGFKQKPVKELLGHRSNIFCAIFDHSNRHILSCGNDETILRFDIEYAKQGKGLFCHFLILSFCLRNFWIQMLCLCFSFWL